MLVKYVRVYDDKLLLTDSISVRLKRIYLGSSSNYYMLGYRTLQWLSIKV